MDWHVVSVASRMELETVRRINLGGFVALCPTWVKKSAHHRNGRHFFSSRVQVLFPTYIFLKPNAAFRRDIFEDSRTRLYFLPNGWISDAQMTEINNMANKLTLEQSRTIEPVVFARGEAVQVLTAAMAGKQLKVLEVRRKGSKLLVEFVERAGSYPFEVDSSSVTRAV